MGKTAFLIGQINVKSYPQYLNEYGRPVFAEATKHGGEFLVATRQPMCVSAPLDLYNASANLIAPL